MAPQGLTDDQLLRAAEQYGTPLYVYDADRIRHQYDRLLSFFPWEKTSLYYAMKANYNPAILALLKEKGASIDAVSLGDVLLARRMGFPKERILFTANKITDEEMHAVAEEGILFNIGSLTRLERYGAAYPGSRVCLRVNPDVKAGANEQVMTGGADSKFGIRIDRIGEARKIAEEYGLRVVGLHEHTGSGIPEATNILSAMDSLASLVRPQDFPHLEFVDFGGGFKIPYHSGEKEQDYTSLGDQATELMRRLSDQYGRDLEMRFEPGRYLVGQAGYFLTRATVLKDVPAKRLVGVDSGFPQLIRPMFYGSYHHIRNVSNPDGRPETYDVVGNICETGDVFGEDRKLPETREGDVLVIGNAGAYCYSMGGVYNLRPMPSEVVAEGGSFRLVRKGLSEKELVERILSESVTG